MSIVADTRSTLGSLAGALEFVVDRVTIENVVTKLNNTITALETSATQLTAVGGNSFGGSWYGNLVHSHNQLAYDAVLDALGSLNTGMQHYIATMKQLEKDTDAAEEASAAATKSTMAGIECTTVASGGPGVCLPSDGTN